jgi:uncharacterized protein (DUF697 family)
MTHPNEPTFEDTQAASSPNPPSKTPAPSTTAESNSICESVAGMAANVTEAMTTAAQVGETLSKTAMHTATQMADATAQASQQLFDKATEEAGKILGLIGDNPVIKQILKVFRAEWLLSLVGQVDTTKVAQEVAKIQQEYPDETPNQIAHRIMTQKALQAGGIGLASSLLPGIAVALLAIDLVATTQLQAEMIYEIAAVYGLPLNDPARRGEVLAIFGLSLGGGEAVKAGLGLLRNVPVAGAVIGASTNAVMLYTLGYAACRFYESKVNPMSSPEAAEEIKQESEQYLEKALAQQVIMDQILVHMILASNPDQSWDDILPELKSLSLSQKSLEVIAAHIQSPQPLDNLLDQLDPDFAYPLLARCYTIAQLDCVTTSEEASLMQKIAGKFDIDLKKVDESFKEVMGNG